MGFPCLANPETWLCYMLQYRTQVKKHLMVLIPSMYVATATEFYISQIIHN